MQSTQLASLKAEPSKVVGFLYCLQYAISAWVLVLLNKQLLTFWQFNDVQIYLLLEQSFFFIVSILWKPIIPHLFGLEIELFNRQQLKASFPLTLIILVGTYLSLDSLSVIPVAIYTVIKRTMPLIVMVINFIFYFRKPNSLSSLGVLFMLSGGVLTCLNLNDINWYGVVLLELAMLVQSFQQIQIEWMGKNTTLKINVFCLMYYNSVVIVPILAVVCYFTNSQEQLYKYKYNTDSNFILMFALFLVMATQLVISQTLCSLKNSALATVVTSNFKDILLTFIGLVLYTDVVINKQIIIGITISIVGALVFGQSKIMIVGKKEKKLKHKIETLVHEKMNQDDDDQKDSLGNQEMIERVNYVSLKKMMLKSSTLLQDRTKDDD